MKYKTLCIFCILALTACSQTEQGSSGIEITSQQLHNNKEPILLEMNSDVEIEPNADLFDKMEYLFLVQEEVGSYGDGMMPWYEFALLGGDYKTYAEGHTCYEEINKFYEMWVDGFDDPQLKYKEGVIRDQFRRNIAVFSPDGEYILLKTHTNPPYDDIMLYEIYQNQKSQNSYYYDDIIQPVRINYTKALQYIQLNDAESYLQCGEIGDFYKSSEISQNQVNAEIFQISTTTNFDDTWYYKRDSDEFGGKCIGIYSVTDNDLVFQSKTIANYPITMTILEHKLIAGFQSSHSYGLDYFEINIDTDEWSYLFTKPNGSFSPDGKYFVYSERTRMDRGYMLYCIENGNQMFVKSYSQDTEPIEYSGNNTVICWVNKSKIKDLLELRSNNK